MKRVLLSVGATILTLYLLACVGLFLAQRSMIFYPQRAPVTGPLERFGLRLVETRGQTVELLHFPAPPGAPTVVHFHGNAEQLVELLDLAEAFRAHGLGFAAIEYPGYGRAPGEPTEESIYQAAEDGLQFLAGEGLAPERTVLSGRSLGTGVATEMARRGHGTRLMLIAPYTSLTAMGARQFGWLPVRLLMRDRFATDQKAKDLQLPVLIVHGQDDSLVPVAMGKELANTFPQATLEVIPGRGHNDVLDGATTISRLAEFARQAPRSR